MKWIKVEAGEYRSDNERFSILKSWNRINGGSWELTDFKTKRVLNYDTLKQCQSMAEDLLQLEEKRKWKQ